MEDVSSIVESVLALESRVFVPSDTDRDWLDFLAPFRYSMDRHVSQR